RRHTRSTRDWSSDVCSSDLAPALLLLFLYVAPSVNDITRVPAMIDGAACIPISSLAPSIPVPIAQTPTSGSLIGRRGSVAFLVEIGRASCRERVEVSVCVV